jgi:hypothetical protein
MTKLNTDLLQTFVIIGLSLGSAVLSPVYAEDMQVGRLSDGSAYRVDQDGTKITDYIAELELSVLDLERSAEATHNENQLLRAEIQRLKSGRHDFIVETNLAVTASPQASPSSGEIDKSNPSPEVSIDTKILPCNQDLLLAEVRLSLSRDLQLLLKEKDSRDLRLTEQHLSPVDLAAEKNLIDSFETGISKLNSQDDFIKLKRNISYHTEKIKQEAAE